LADLLASLKRASQAESSCTDDNPWNLFGTALKITDINAKFPLHVVISLTAKMSKNVRATILPHSRAMQGPYLSIE